MSFEETYSSICPTLPLLHILINLPLHFGLFLPTRLLRHLVPPVQLTNKAAIPGELTFSTLILLSLISVSLFIALLTTDFPLLLYTTPRPWSLSSPPFLSLLPSLRIRHWTLLLLPRALYCLPYPQYTLSTWVSTQVKEYSFLITVLTPPPAIQWLSPGWPPSPDVHLLFPPSSLTCLPASRPGTALLCPPCLLTLFNSWNLVLSLLALARNSILPLLSFHPHSSVQQHSSSFRLLHVGELAHCNTVIISILRMMTSPPLPIFLGTPITSPQISYLICLVMKTGETLVTLTFSSLLPLLVPGCQNFLPFLSGVPRTPLTLPLTTP